MNKAKKLITMGLRTNRPILLVGQPGCGKTDLCRQISEELIMDFIVDVATIADPTDARGLPGIHDGKAEYFPYGIMRKLIEAQRPTLCLLDDVGQAASEVQKAYMHLVLARRAGEHEISPQVRFILATNDLGHSAGVMGIIAPLQNRAYHIRVSPHVPTWCAWAVKHEIIPEVIAFARSTPNIFEDWQQPPGIEASCTPRSLHMLSDFAKEGANSIIEYSGAIGPKIAPQFAAYRKKYMALPHISKIISSPKTAPIPSSLDEQYAIYSALACEKENWDKILIYLQRLPVEMQVSCVTDATSRYPDLLKDTSITNWITKNKNILL